MLSKVPVMLVLAKREVEERRVCSRRLGAKDQSTAGFDEALGALAAEATPPDLR